MFLEFPQTGRRQLISLKDVELGFDHGLALRDVFVGQGSIGDKIFRLVVLEFDGVRSTIGSSIDGAMGEVQVTVVVDADLGRKDAGLTLSNPAISDLRYLHK